ncbi:PH domain-containing protein [Thermobifida alba]|uniref:PH domain-containing protein n=1 Tax=Thermobifida alba TaxID=53522 RepID=A0ABY4L034_THEAE|nr:PH domain-containing protein [Thermobifida alba]UPT20834.1 PH domain-containing protein [Thermobifida alba]
MDAQTAARATDVEPVWLRLPKHRVESRARVWWAAQAFVRFLFIAGAMALLYLWVEQLRPWLGPPLVVVLVGGVLYIAVMPFWRYAVHRWEFTEEAVYSRTGWYVREWRVAPLSRIQTVDTVQGPIEQLLGLARLAVTTASAHGAIYISGLDQETAAEAARRLTEITQLTPGDQT